MRGIETGRRALAIRPGFVSLAAMSDLTCPMCEMNEILELPEIYECVTCGHEWPREEEARVVKDAHGNVLASGDIVAMVKDLKLKGSSQVLKRGTKSKPIRLVDGDHEIDCKMDGMAIALKAQFVKKVTS
jgi:protein PhnA